MSKAKRKAKELIDEDPDLKPVLERLLSLEESQGEIEWKDVKTDATSGQWGRLIEKGVLVEADGNGFELADTEGVKEALGIEPSPSSGETVEVDDDVDTSWTYLDKGAALVGAFLIIFGYRDPQIQAVIGEAINTVIIPLHSVGLPYYLIVLLLATLTGLYSSYLQLYLMDWDWISAQQEKVQEIQSQLKEAQLGGNEAKQERLQEEQREVMSEQMKMFKMQFRPSVWIMVITIPIFIWLYWSFGGRANIPAHVSTMPTVNMPFVGQGAIEFNTQVIGFLPVGQAWFVWYILCSFGFGQIMRKVLGVNPST